MKLLERIIFNQTDMPKITIGIDAMPIKNELKELCLIALSNNEDFALRNDSGDYVYFINREFMVVIKHDGRGNAVTHLPDILSLQNAIKLALLGHSQFISHIGLLMDKGYKQLKDAAETPLLT